MLELEDQEGSERGLSSAQSFTNMDGTSIIGVQIVLPNGKRINGLQTSSNGEMTNMLGGNSQHNQVIDDFSSMNGSVFTGMGRSKHNFNDNQSESRSLFNIRGPCGPNTISETGSFMGMSSKNSYNTKKTPNQIVDDFSSQNQMSVKQFQSSGRVDV